MHDYTCTFTMQAPPARVYAALTTPDGLRGWWTEDCDVGAAVGDSATFRFGKTHKTFRIETLTPERMICWRCTEQYHHLPGILKKTDEWVGTRLRFALEPEGEGGTRLSFTHEGLVPTMECYAICQGGWDHFLKTSLKNFVERGKGEPYNDRYPYSED